MTVNNYLCGKLPSFFFLNKELLELRDQGKTSLNLSRSIKFLGVIENGKPKQNEHNGLSWIA